MQSCVFFSYLCWRQNCAIHLESVPARCHGWKQLWIDLGAIAQDLVPLNLVRWRGIVVLVVAAGRQGFPGHNLEAGGQLFGHSWEEKIPSNWSLATPHWFFLCSTYQWASDNPSWALGDLQWAPSVSFSFSGRLVPWRWTAGTAPSPCPWRSPRRGGPARSWTGRKGGGRSGIRPSHFAVASNCST